MQETNDSVLLREFVENRSEDAFAALVGRHINLVYSVALRHVDQPHQAEEVTQAVFIILAQKARQLRSAEALSSWLFQTTRLTSANLRRTELRRVRREQEAHMQSLSHESENESEIWSQVAPLLDSAVASLNENDRRAVVLRFYEGKNLREVGAALGTSEDAAFQRSNRAVEKLRKFFGKRGFVFPAAVLTAAISANSVHAAPAGLATGVTSGALTGSSLAAVALSDVTLKAMAWLKMKSALSVGAVLLLAGGAIAFALTNGGEEKSEAKEILKQVSKKYASLSSYSDTVKTLSGTSAVKKGRDYGATSADAMSMKLGRPGRYRFEEITGQPWSMWTTGDGEFWMLLQNNFYRTNDKRSGSELVFLPPLGIIPSAFFENKNGDILKALAASADLRKERDEAVDGTECYAVGGSQRLANFPKIHLTIWIGKKDWLVRRAEAVMTANTRVPYTNRVVQTHENISVNQALEKEQFAHPLPAGAKPINSFPFQGNSSRK